MVTPCMYLAHRQPDLFPNPHRFIPSRFLGNRVSRQYDFPFGGGTRHRLGNELAMLKVRMIAAAVLRRYQLHRVNPETGISELHGPAMTLAQGLRMSITHIVWRHGTYPARADGGTSSEFRLYRHYYG
jgi:cytochrome P450